MTDHHGKYGPRTEIVERVIERAGRLTNDEVRALADAWDAAVEDDSWHAYWSAAFSTTMNAVRVAAGVTAWDTIRAAAWGAAWGAIENADDWDITYTAAKAVTAAGDAALIAVVVYLEGQHGLTREHLEILAEPWRQVVTDVDPLEEI